METFPSILDSIVGNSYANLFEHNIVQEIEADWSTSGIPGFTDPHGYNGPYNAFVRNIVYIGNYQEPPFNIYSDEFGLSNAPIRAFLVAS